MNAAKIIAAQDRLGAFLRESGHAFTTRDLSSVVGGWMRWPHNPSCYVGQASARVHKSHFQFCFGDVDAIALPVGNAHTTRPALEALEAMGHVERFRENNQVFWQWIGPDPVDMAAFELELRL